MRIESASPTASYARIADFAFLRSTDRVAQRLHDVLAFEIRIVGQYVIDKKPTTNFSLFINSYLSKR